ncbi:unnamed protein product [Caenorhabditis angaria]|uniref:Uncharacterized protein n=1 Tax=Caenorhabditis angaria TaxID=860376 RepID=A0A9P1N0G4_9PELO|nr:unnamed protein product [Caenorhabditis angaria]
MNTHPFIDIFFKGKIWNLYFFSLIIMDDLECRAIEQLLFTTSHPSNSLNFCVIVFHPQFAVTFRHPPHHNFVKNEIVKVWNVLNRMEYETTVFEISTECDFIVLKIISGTFPHSPRLNGSLYRGQVYFQVGVNGVREPFWKTGVISEKTMSFAVGTSLGSPGDSGSGVFDQNGNFIGISTAKQTFIFANGNFALCELADFQPYTKITDAIVIIHAAKLTAINCSRSGRQFRRLQC